MANSGRLRLFFLGASLIWQACCEQNLKTKHLKQEWDFKLFHPNTQGITAIFTYKISVRPGRLTWNLQITHLERKIIFQTPMIMFRVNLPGCKKRESSVFFCGLPWPRHQRVDLVGLPSAPSQANLSRSRQVRWRMVDIRKVVLLGEVLGCSVYIYIKKYI